MAFLQDFIINEGLRRWNVHYYIVAIKKQDQSVTLHVAYEVLHHSHQKSITPSADCPAFHPS